jgi:hypothetical protein
MIRKLLFMGLTLTVAVGAYTWWMFNMPHENVQKLETYGQFTIAQLVTDFPTDPDRMDKELFDQAIEVEGVIKRLSREEGQTILTFDEGGDFITQAYLPADVNEAIKLQEAEAVKLKCKYSGYVINDESFLIPADIKLEKCFVVTD